MCHSHLILHFLDEQSKIAAPVVVYVGPDVELGGCKEGYVFASNEREIGTANAQFEEEAFDVFLMRFLSGRKRHRSKQAALLPVGMCLLVLQ